MTKPPKQWDQDLPPWVVTGPKPRARKAPKPRARKAPKPAVPVKPTPPKIPLKPEPVRLHLRAELAGWVELIVPSNETIELRALLDRGASEDVLDYLDPWTSGVKLHMEIRVVSDPDPKDGSYYTWSISEGVAAIDDGMGWFGPFLYAAGGNDKYTGKPTGVDWTRVE